MAPAESEFHCVDQIDFNFKKRLIAQVQKHQELYNASHEKFANAAAKAAAWESISNQLTTEVEICKNSWLDLRLDYQRYVRRLRKYFRTKNKAGKRRPIMSMETDMIFLWRFVADTSHCPIPKSEDEQGESAAKDKDADLSTTIAAVEDEDEDVMLVDDPIVVIDLDDEDEDEPTSKRPRTLPRYCEFELTQQARKLVDIVRVYPELYDTEHRYFNDYRRKGIIWNAIANEMSDKATKLMKLWFHLQTRYEWELCVDSWKEKNELDGPNEFQKCLSFLKNHILNNPNTVYKQSCYLKRSWGDPFDNFKSIFSLLSTLKKFPLLIDLTETMITTMHDKILEYTKLWVTVAASRGATASQCESTWLILRAFYWELMNMRKHGYQLQDKWYFESIISDLYAHVATVRPITPGAATAASTAPLPGQMQFVDNDRTPTASPNAIPLKLPIIQSAVSLAPMPVGLSNETLAHQPISKMPSPPPLVLMSDMNTTVSSTSTLNSNRVVLNIPYNLPHNTKVTGLANGSSMPVMLAPGSEVAASTAPKATYTVDLTSVPFVQTPMPSVPPTMPSDPPPMPKLAGTCTKSLNANEIMVELIASSNSKYLVIHGPPLSEKYTLSMSKTTRFIREAMSIPQLHNKNNKGAEISIYWQYLSMKFNLPTHICRACWNFLSENFSHFPQIAPMHELMQPFKPNIIVWSESNFLFTEFDKHAVMSGWLNNNKKELMILFGDVSKYPCLYADLTRDGKKPPNLNVSSNDVDVATAWTLIFQKTGKISKKISDIWAAFKNVFWTYMSELERGIDNKWPQHWWRELSRLKFLMEVRYHTMEPLYYIVRNKIVEEINRCAAVSKEHKKSIEQPTLKSIAPKWNNSYESRAIGATPTAPAATTALPIAPPAAAAAAAAAAPPVAAASTAAAPSALTAMVLSAMPNISSDNAQETTRAPTTSVASPDCLSPASYVTTGKLQNETGHCIDTYKVVLAVLQRPKIYQESSEEEKLEAWNQVAQELNASPYTCQATFQRAFINYRICRMRDPANRCRIAQKYFKPMDDIWRATKPQSNKNIKTPKELNQQSVTDADESTETVFPERFLVSISMDNCKPALVMKNWAYATDYFPAYWQLIVTQKLSILFDKYRSLVT